MYNQGVTLFMHFDITFSFFSVFLFLLPYFWEHFPNQCLRGIDLCPGASLLVQWGRLCPSTIQVQVPSLVGELRFYMLHRVAKIIIVITGLCLQLCFQENPTGSGSGKSALGTGFWNKTTFAVIQQQGPCCHSSEWRAYSS